MNPLVLFDYVYYSIAYLYENTFNRKTSNEFSGIITLSLFQLLNILTLTNFFNPINIIVNEPLIFWLGYLIILAINLIRYKKFVDYSNLSLKWDGEDRKPKLIKIAFVIGYFLFTLFLFIYSGNIT